jgi:hypothetical protein
MRARHTNCLVSRDATSQKEGLGRRALHGGSWGAGGERPLVVPLAQHWVAGTRSGVEGTGREGDGAEVKVAQPWKSRPPPTPPPPPINHRVCPHPATHINHRVCPSSRNTHAHSDAPITADVTAGMTSCRPGTPMRALNSWFCEVNSGRAHRLTDTHGVMRRNDVLGNVHGCFKRIVEGDGGHMRVPGARQEIFP